MHHQCHTTQYILRAGVSQGHWVSEQRSSPRAGPPVETESRPGGDTEEAGPPVGATRVSDPGLATL